MTRKILPLVILMMSVLTVRGQIEFRFNSGLYNTKIKTSSEKNISMLLTAINQAASTNTDINLSNVIMTPQAKEGLESMWNSIHFECKVGNHFEQTCLKDAIGYEVRQIPVKIVWNDGTYFNDKERELTLSFDAGSKITGVRFAMDENSYMRILEEGSSVEEERQIREILKFVEDYRSYYIEKNLTAIEQIFSDDALIITGRVIKTLEKSRIDGTTRRVREQIEYSKQNKQQYIANLSRLFKNNKSLAVDFQNIDVLRHSTKEGYFGVRLHQKWDSVDNRGKKYSDDGFIFLLWDFTDETNPKIHVRQWAPNAANITQDDLLSPDNFFIP